MGYKLCCNTGSTESVKRIHDKGNKKGFGAVWSHFHIRKNMFPQADEWVMHWPLRVWAARQANVIWRGWADWKSREASNTATPMIMEQHLLCHSFVCLLSPSLYCAVLRSLHKCSISLWVHYSMCFNKLHSCPPITRGIPPQQRIFFHPWEVPCELAPTDFWPIPIWLQWLFTPSKLLCVLLILLFRTVLTCAVCACSSISSNSWYSSSSGSAPESRAALAIKYGGSSPMAVPAPWEKNNSDLFWCLFFHRKHVLCRALWTFQTMRPDESSCSERSLLLSSRSDLFWFQTQGCSSETSLSPFSSFSNLQLLSQRSLSSCKPVAPKLWCARSKRCDLCIPGALPSGTVPSAGRAPQPVASCPAAVGRLQLVAGLQPESWPGWGPCYPTRSLTQHTAAISPHHMMPDTFASMWPPVLLSSLPSNVGTPPRCRHGVYLFSHETLGKCLLENRLKCYYSYEQGTGGWAKLDLDFSLSFGRNKSQDESMAAFSPQENYICFLRTSNDSFQSCG